MGIQDRDWYHEHRDKVAAADRARYRQQPPDNQAFDILRRHQEAALISKPFGIWKQIGLFTLICLAVVGALFLVVFFRAHWLR